MLLTTEVKINVSGKSKYYEDLGYHIEKHFINGDQNRIGVPRNFILTVDVKDLRNTCTEKILFKCDECTKEFTTSFISYKRKNFSKGDFCNSCSKKMYNSGKDNPLYGIKLERICGEKNHNWNPNLTTEERLINRALPENITWRNLVLNRDNYNCTVCKERGSGIEAHHLNSYTNFKEERFNINNGVTLCKECHKSYHKAFGYKNSTKEKFETYLNEIKCVLFN